MHRVALPLVALLLFLFLDCFAQDTAVQGRIYGAGGEDVAIALCAEEARDNCVVGLVEVADDGTLTYEVTSFPTYGCDGECFTRNLLVATADGCRDIEIADDFVLDASLDPAVRDIELDCP